MERFVKRPPRLLDNMDYTPVDISRSEGGSIVPEPNNGDVRVVQFNQKNKQSCLIEWESDDDCWIIAANQGSYVDLDTRL